MAGWMTLLFGSLLVGSAFASASEIALNTGTNLCDFNVLYIPALER